MVTRVNHLRNAKMHIVKTKNYKKLYEQNQLVKDRVTQLLLVKDLEDGSQRDRWWTVMKKTLTEPV